MIPKSQDPRSMIPKFLCPNCDELCDAIVTTQFHKNVDTKKTAAVMGITFTCLDCNIRMTLAFSTPDWHVHEPKNLK